MQKLLLVVSALIRSQRPPVFVSPPPCHLPDHGSVSPAPASASARAAHDSDLYSVKLHEHSSAAAFLLPSPALGLAGAPARTPLRGGAASLAMAAHKAPEKIVICGGGIQVRLL
jgi:hypothetical protein